MLAGSALSHSPVDLNSMHIVYVDSHSTRSKSYAAGGQAKQAQPVFFVICNLFCTGTPRHTHNSLCPLILPTCICSVCIVLSIQCVCNMTTMINVELDPRNITLAVDLLCCKHDGYRYLLPTVNFWVWSWTRGEYLERLHLYFEVNNIANAKKMSVLLYSHWIQDLLITEVK